MGGGCTAILVSPVIGTHARVFHTNCTRVRVSHAFFTHSRAHRNPPPRARTRAFFTRVPPPRTRTHAISTRARVFHSFFTRACAREKRVENASACACKIPQGLNEWTLSVPLQCTYTIKELKLYFYSLHLISDRAVSEGNAVPSLAD